MREVERVDGQAGWRMVSADIYDGKCACGAGASESEGRFE